MIREGFAQSYFLMGTHEQGLMSPMTYERRYLHPDVAYFVAIMPFCPDMAVC